jgi:hypothetical protein
LLQRERGPDGDFAPQEVVDRANQEGLSGERRPGLKQHAQYHAVASRRPNPGRYRLLTETRPGRRRLFRLGDPYHPEREGGKSYPRIEELPERYRPLVEWYLNEYAGQRSRAELHPMDELRAWVREAGLFRGVDADEYVRTLRAGWDE